MECFHQAGEAERQRLPTESGNPTLRSKDRGSLVLGIETASQFKDGPGEMLALKCCLLRASPTGQNKQGGFCVDRYGQPWGARGAPAPFSSGWDGRLESERKGIIFSCFSRVNTFQAPPLRADHLCAFLSSQLQPFLLSTHIPWAPGEQLDAMEEDGFGLGGCSLPPQI